MSGETNESAEGEGAGRLAFLLLFLFPVSFTYAAAVDGDSGC